MIGHSMKCLVALFNEWDLTSHVPKMEQGIHSLQGKPVENTKPCKGEGTHLLSAALIPMGMMYLCEKGLI